MSKSIRSRSAKKDTGIQLTLPRAGFRRRLGAWVIDALLVIPLLAVAGYAGYGVGHLLTASGLVSLAEGESMSNWLAHQLWFSLYLYIMFTPLLFIHTQSLLKLCSYSHKYLLDQVHRQRSILHHY